MKKTICILAAALLLFSCAKGQTDDGTNDQWSDYRQQNQIEGSCIETEDAIYALREGYIYFTDKNKEPSKWMILCNKPDCNHSTSDCNGAVDTSTIGNYNNKIYYVQNGFLPEQNKVELALYSMEYDGSNHRKERTLRDDVSNIGYTSIMNRQYCLWTEEVWRDETESNHIVLYAVSMNNEDPPKTIADSDQIGAFYYKPIGDFVYLTVRQQEKTSLLRYSFLTGETETMIDDWNLPYRGVPSEAYYTEDGVYYFDCQIGLNYFDYSTQSVSSLHEPSYDEFGAAHSDGEFIYLSTVSIPTHTLDKQELYIYDLEGKFLNRLDLPKTPNTNPSWFYTSTDEYIFASDNYMGFPRYYLSKDEMLNAESSWKECEQR